MSIRIRLLILLLLLLWAVGCDHPEPAAVTAFQASQTDASTQYTSYEILPYRVEDDRDLDGIVDKREAIDGTDPDDPASARAWHPDEIGPFPRLVAAADRWAFVREQVQNSVEPYRTDFRQATSGADAAPAEPSVSDYDPNACLYNARLARKAAVRFWGQGNAADAAKASALIRNTDPNFEVWTYDTLDHGGILVSQALILLCQTYEILAVSDGFGPGEAEQAAATIKQLAASMVHFYVDFMPLWLMATRNNHTIKFWAGIGYVALTFNDWDRAAELINGALTETVYWQLEIQNCPGAGCCPEGPNYLAYSAINYLPFFLAYSRFADGRVYPYKTSCAHHVWPWCEPEIVEMGDPLDDARFIELHEWWRRLRLPGGYGPPLDDANLHCFPLGVIAAVTGDGRYQWAHENGAQCMNFTGDLSWEQMLLTPDAPAAQTPPDDELFWSSPEAGQAVARSGWDDDARYLLLNAEHDKARVQGMGHEQPDATSFQLVALGEMFLIDSGYISYDERQHVAGPENHNLILVDGQGPPRGFQGLGTDVDAYLTEAQRDGDVAYFVAQSAWAGASFTRWTGLIADDYFVVADWADGNGAHAYDWLGHTQAGGTTNGEFFPADNGATLQRPNGDMTLAVAAAPGGAVLSDYEDEHGFSHGGIQLHRVLRARAVADDPTFLAVFAPLWPDDPQPVLRSPNCGDSVAVHILEKDGVIDVCASALPGTDNELAPTATELPRIASDAQLFWVRWDAATLTVRQTWRRGGTYLTVGD